MVVRRVPPPPPIAINDPVFNRWLHDLTEFIKEGGGIDTGVIPGYDVLVSTVETHTTQISDNAINIADNTSDIGVNTSNIATNTSNIATNTSNIATNTANIATLTARSQVLNGTVPPAVGLGIEGDWYADTVAKHIHVKSSGIWVLII